MSNFADRLESPKIDRGNAALLTTGVLCATLIGLVGGFFPALRAARLPVAEALRET